MKQLSLQLKSGNLNVDLALPGRGVTAIFGPSGAGKTTLLRFVAGLEHHVGARLEVHGEVWQDDKTGLFVPPHKRAVGFVFQEASLFSHLSVQKNIEFGLHRVPHAEQIISLSKVVDLLGIQTILSRLPETLSGGERARVAIARALASSPKVLLMDEPLASLDWQRKSEILPYLRQLHQEFAMPILYVTHAVDEVAQLADFAIVLEAGNVRAAGSVCELFTRTDLPFSQGDGSSALFDAIISQHDTAYTLTEATFTGGRLWFGAVDLLPGTKIRMRIAARDVSLVLQRQTGTSILNCLAVTVLAIQDSGNGLVQVELDASGTRLLSRITRKSADLLGLVIGLPLFAQIKGVAIQK